MGLLYQHPESLYQLKLRVETAHNLWYWQDNPTTKCRLLLEYNFYGCQGEKYVIYGDTCQCLIRFNGFYKSSNYVKGAIKDSSLNKIHAWTYDTKVVIIQFTLYYQIMYFNR